MTVDEREGTGPSADAIGLLLDQAVRAVNEGDLATAHDLAGQVLEKEAGNTEAADLLATGTPPAGELRRLTILSLDLVGSTELSERLDPEPYHALVRAYRSRSREIIEGRYDGHITSVTGDGIFALFGYPTAHEEDATRAVKAALDVCRVVEELSARAASALGESLAVRAAVHRGMVFIDQSEADVYGLAANVTARLQSLGEPGRVSISEPVRRVVADRFDIEAGDLQTVRGVAEPIPTFTIVSERPASVRHRAGGPLVGRDAELDVLRAAWGEVRRSEATRVVSALVTGEAGVGKSRLAAELADHVRADRGLVVELAGSSFHTDAGLHPVQRLIERRSGIGALATGEERLTRLRNELGASGLPDEATALLAPVLGLSPEAGYDPADSEGRKLDDEIRGAAQRYVLSCFGGGPGLLLVEDVQWFDDSTLALLQDLLRESRGDLLVVLTSREPAALPAGTTIDLEPLTRDQCIELVDALDERALDRRARSALVDRSDGIPLYLEELLRGGPVDTDPQGSNVPDVLYEPLVARLYSTAHGVPVAAAAAAIGREVDRDLLHRAVDLPADTVDAELNALIEGRVLAPTGDPNGLRFRHELLREVAYELQPPSHRLRVHGRVADLLVGDTPSELVDWPVVATHFERAERPGDAAAAFAQASDRARRRGAIAEARSHLGRAVDQVLGLPDDRARMRREVDLRLRRGFLAMSAEGAGSAEAATDFARCLEVAMVDAQGDEMFSTLISLWAYHLSRAELDRAGQVLDTLRGALTGTREYFRAANRAGYGMIEWFRGDYPAALSILEEAMAELLVADPGEEVDSVWFVPNDPVAAMHTHLAMARFTAGDSCGAEAQLRLTAEVTAALPFPQGAWSQAYAMWLTAWMQIEQGRYAEALTTSDALVGLATRHGFDNWSMLAMTNQAAAQAARAAHEGTAEEASVHAGSLAGLIGLWQAVELVIVTPFYLATVAGALAATGDRDAARDRLRESIAVGEQTGMRFYEAEARRRLALLGDDDAQVSAGLWGALEVARAQGARPFELRTALDLDGRGEPGGRDALEVAVAGFRPDAQLADLTRARALIAPPA